MQARQQEQGMGSLDGDSIDGDFPYDNMSQSSYGSHKNRNFESRSHQGVGSLDELRNQEENEKLRLLMMNGSSATNGVSPLQIIYILTSPGFFNCELYEFIPCMLVEITFNYYLYAEDFELIMQLMHLFYDLCSIFFPNHFTIFHF